MSDDTTTIQVWINNYRRLSGLKNPGDSSDDVIGRVLNDYKNTGGDAEEHDQPGENPSTSSDDQSTDDASETGNEGPSKQTPPTNSERSRQVTFDPDDKFEDDVEQAIFELDLSTSADREKWIPVIRAAYRYLSEREEASKQNFIDDVFPDAPAGYDNEETWWRKVIKPGLTDLRKAEKPHIGRVALRTAQRMTDYVLLSPREDCSGETIGSDQISWIEK